MEQALRDKVIAFVQAKDTDRPALREAAQEAMRERKEFAPDALTEQRLVCARIALGSSDGPYSPEKQSTILLEAIRLTLPGFTPERIDSFRYSQEEITLINQLAISYAQGGNSPAAIQIVV